MLMSQVLQLLLDGERLSTDQMAEVLGLSPDDIDQELDRLSTEKVLLGWRPVLKPRTCRSRPREGSYRGQNQPRARGRI